MKPNHSESAEKPAESKISREERFVTALIERCQKNKGDAAKLRRANNPATEYQSWEILATYGVNLESEGERLPFATVAAAIAQEKLKQDGSAPLGIALAHCYDDKQNSDQAKAKLRRLLACDDVRELVRLLRPLLALIQSKSSKTLSYTGLLKQLRRFYWDAQRIKATWAQEFYRQGSSDKKQAEVSE